MTAGMSLHLARVRSPQGEDARLQGGLVQRVTRRRDGTSVARLVEYSTMMCWTRLLPCSPSAAGVADPLQTRG